MKDTGALNIKTECDAVLWVNGQYSGVLGKGNDIAMPLNGEMTVFASPLKREMLPACFYIGRNFRLAEGYGRLNRWSDELFELELCFPAVPENAPPIITKEEEWGEGVAAICGNRFVCEDGAGNRRCYFRAVTDFRLLGKFVMLYFGNTAAIFDKELNCVFPEAHYISFSVKETVAEAVFTLGDMDCCEIFRRFSLNDMSVTESSVRLDDASRGTGLLRCFCQAVRLKLEAEAMSFLVPDINMSFAEISDFLGVFDRVEPVKYIPAPESSIALRYKIDESNFQYMRFAFKLRDGLIDDIEQL